VNYKDVLPIVMDNENVKQVAVLGDAQDENFQKLMKVVRGQYRPNSVVAASAYPPGKEAPHLLRDRPLIGGKPTAYVCEGFVCRQPVANADELKKQL